MTVTRRPNISANLNLVELWTAQIHVSGREKTNPGKKKAIPVTTARAKERRGKELFGVKFS
jgi:hypothetical protein